MESVIFETPWIKIKRTPRGFDYLERKGKDSVAIFLVRNAANGKEVLIRWQPLCVHNVDVDEQQLLFPCPITGGIEEGEKAIDSAIREVKEESGYVVDRLTLLTTYIVGTQTNERCFMYWADVTGLIPEQAAQDGSYFESVSRNQWQSISDLAQCEYVACQLAYAFLEKQ